MKKLFILLLFLLATPFSAGAEPWYPWRPDAADLDTIASRFAPPPGYHRTSETPGSFGDWLRHLPLKPEGSPVHLYDGRLKPNQQAHCAVIDIDAGDSDLQQCADAVMRLRAEYLYSRAAYNRIRFNFTSGDTARYSRWRQGFRPVVHGNRVDWRNSATADDSYDNFRDYLDSVFMYAGTWSLSQELRPRRNARDIAIGDVFIKGGFPGHAVIVVDMAVDPESGDKAFLLAQSYMPAQDIHVLRNPASRDGSPWYHLPRNGKLRTPEWDFRITELKTFDDAITQLSGLDRGVTAHHDR